MAPTILRRGVQGILLACALCATTPTLAQSPAPAAAQPRTGAAKDEWDKNVRLLSDFIHYTRIRRYDIAAGIARQLTAKNLLATDFVDLVESSGELGRFQDTMGLALRQPELEATAASMLKVYDQGKLERVRNADEITRNIGLLKGVQRARILARERLAAAGEYAMPQLLQALLNRNDPELQAQAQRLMQDMGQQAVAPLCAALPKLEPAAQEMVADILGLLAYRTAVPYLHDVLMSTQAVGVRTACDRALTRIGGAGTGSTSDLYRDLAEAYYGERAELTSFPGEPNQLLWDYQPQIGLLPTAIFTSVFHEAMAMRTAERSLALQPAGNESALSLWLASNFSREIDSLADYENPAYPKTRRDAMYWAVTAGAGPSQAVLARAITSRDTPLARRAIAAIDQTAGGTVLWSDKNGTAPLRDSLGYPNRRVQYEAALALGKAQPQQGFAGSERVVPILASAIRDAGVRFAVIIATNKEIGEGHRRTLERAGYTVMPVSATLAELAGAIAEAPGVDLIVSNLNGDPTVALINEVRGSAKLVATPVLALTSPPANIDLARKYDRDATVAVRPTGLSDAQLAEAASQLVQNASGGPITDDEAGVYATRSLGVLRDLAVSGNTVFDVGDAALPLISALSDAKGETRLDVAEVLGRINQKRAQVALADGALGATGDERVALLGKLADSAKRFGNQLEPRQVQRVIELASTGADKEATAAAAVVGSLNLPQTNIVPLILGQK
ncbi:MAG: hypothetical protein ACKVW3_13690 [Phycisphaerales bacterium]